MIKFSVSQLQTLPAWFCAIKPDFIWYSWHLFEVQCENKDTCLSSTVCALLPMCKKRIVIFWWAKLNNAYLQYLFTKRKKKNNFYYCSLWRWSVYNAKKSRLPINDFYFRGHIISLTRSVWFLLLHTAKVHYLAIVLSCDVKLTEFQWLNR